MNKDISHFIHFAKYLDDYINMNQLMSMEIKPKAKPKKWYARGLTFISKRQAGDKCYIYY